MKMPKALYLLFCQCSVIPQFVYLATQTLGEIIGDNFLQFVQFFWSL